MTVTHDEHEGTAKYMDKLVKIARDTHTFNHDLLLEGRKIPATHIILDYYEENHPDALKTKLRTAKDTAQRYKTTLMTEVERKQHVEQQLVSLIRKFNQHSVEIAKKDEEIRVMEGHIDQWKKLIDDYKKLWREEELIAIFCYSVMVGFGVLIFLMCAYGHFYFDIGKS